MHVVILAAGRGSRMGTSLPKVLHTLGGQTLLGRLLSTVSKLQPSVVTVVYGHAGAQVRSAFSEAPIQWVQQETPLGTGHALLQALPSIAPTERVMVLYVDTPCLSVSLLQALETSAEGKDWAIVTAQLEPERATSLGRIVRHPGGAIDRIVEAKDASEAVLNIFEINAGVYLFAPGYLHQYLPQISSRNAQGEYYLTDVLSYAPIERRASVLADPAWEILGVNTLYELMELEALWQEAERQKLLASGTRVDLPFYLRGDLSVGADVCIGPGVLIEGSVHLGDGSSVGAYSVLKDVTLEPFSRIESHSVVEGAHLETGSRAGPFARIRKGTRLMREAKVGHFVELKNTVLGPQTKVNHLSYLGDATVGSSVTIGAGTVTCNYDGYRKHPTFIEDGAFIGSGTYMVAPIRVGAFATVGAGSTLRRDVPPGGLTLTRGNLSHLADWVSPSKRFEAVQDSSEKTEV